MRVSLYNSGQNVPGLLWRFQKDIDEVEIQASLMMLGHYAATLALKYLLKIVKVTWSQ